MDGYEFVNIYGSIIIIILMIPNIIFSLKCKEGFQNKWNHKIILTMEQMGRFGCIGFMIFNIPGTYFGWICEKAYILYFIVNGILLILYCLIWIIYFKKESLFKALSLSIIPSILFLFDGIVTQSILLILAALLFAPSHILISYKNVK